ncbi:MFS transporter, partial [Rhizobium ruizarguesonis]
LSQNRSTLLRDMLYFTACCPASTVAAAILESSIYISGEALQVDDFHLAFYIIAGMTVIATIPFIRMDRNAGALVSGHRLKTMKAA